MTKQQIEAWSLRVINQVKEKQAHEDAFVELKSDWPDVQKAARRIAGHANAAHGEPILWLIGVDEKLGPVAVTPKDMASWLATLRSNFSELSPSITDLVIPIDGITVTALLIETDRAPFVVKNPLHGQLGGGPIELEVPWRDGTSIRSAKRYDLINILTPTVNLPDIEILSAILTLSEIPEAVNTDHAWRWHLNSSLYISPKQSGQIVIPIHKTSGKLLIANDIQPRIINVPLEFKSNDNKSQTIHCTQSELVISGPGAVILDTYVHTPGLNMIIDAVQIVQLAFRPVGTELSLALDVSLERDKEFEKHSLYAGGNVNVREAKPMQTTLYRWGTRAIN